MEREGKTKDEIMKSLNASLSLTGDHIILHGIDLDNIFRKFDRSQKFNLSDVGAVFLVGPFGALITKGSDFASLSAVTMKERDTTEIDKFVSIWKLQNGKIETNDVAFSTKEHLIVLEGKIDILKDSVENLTYGLVDKKGCILISQDVHGKYDNLKFGEIQAISTLLGAVIELVDVMAGSKCEPFYKGTVEHPKLKKE